MATMAVALISVAQAVISVSLRSQLTEHDLMWERRIDGLELSVSTLRKAKLAQDEVNTEILKQLEILQHVRATTEHR